MSENNSSNENIRIDIQDEEDIGEGPFFGSPYPSYLVQVREGGTRGKREAIEVINNHWPANIDELEAESHNQLEEGYSGSFIRSVLRHHYVPEDRFSDVVQSDMEEDIQEEVEVPTTSGDMIPGEDVEEAEMPEETWHKIFRMGIRTALENGIEAEEAFTAFESGFIEGKKLRAEMNWDERE